MPLYPGPKRMTAQPVRPARFFAGKPAREEGSDSDEESESAEEQEKQVQKKTCICEQFIRFCGNLTCHPAPVPEKPSASSFPARIPSTITSNRSKADLDVRKQAAVAEAERLAKERAALEAEFETEEESPEGSGDEDSKSGSGSEESSSSEEEEEESSSDELRKRLRMSRPIFVKRNGVAQKPEKTEDEIWEEEQAKKKAQAHEFVRAELERQAEEKKAGRRYWDDEDVAAEEDVDDTDDLDPEMEYTEWKLRELKRIKRERDKLIEREKELEEKERRRNLTAEEREKEDKERFEQQQAERGEKGQMSYLQKYFHKGAFFTDDLKDAGLAKRDVMGGKFEDQVDRSALPKFMQIRDMNKLGKKGRTRYTDMKSEDTGRFGDYRDPRRRPAEDSNLDDRYKPDYDQDSGPSGANKTALGERKRPGEDYAKESKRARVD